jgi:hypothetical protein
MRVDSIKRWHWITISLVLGLAIGWAWRRSCSNLWAYGEEINDPDQFEAALLNTIADRPQFKQIVVQRQDLPDGSGGVRTVHLVWGKYCNGQSEPDGQLHWRPAVFIADIPYRPRIDLWQTGADGEVISRFANLRSPTVVDFLSVLSTARGVKFTNAWWNTYPLGTALIMVVIVVGGIWPTVINLLVYGRLRRPAEKKGVDLSKVKALPKPPQAQLTQEDLQPLNELEAELEANLEIGAQSNTTTDRPEQSVAPVLSSQPVDSASAIQAEAKAFAAKPEDFYPTELRNRETQT